MIRECRLTVGVSFCIFTSAKSNTGLKPASPLFCSNFLSLERILRWTLKGASTNKSLPRNNRSEQTGWFCSRSLGLSFGLRVQAREQCKCCCIMVFVFSTQMVSVNSFRCASDDGMSDAESIMSQSMQHQGSSKQLLCNSEQPRAGLPTSEVSAPRRETSDSCSADIAVTSGTAFVFVPACGGVHV